MNNPLMEPIPPEAWKTTDGWEVYHWPEFKALCERLGIAWGLPATSITIQLKYGSSPKITQEYLGRDLNEPEKPQVINTAPVL